MDRTEIVNKLRNITRLLEKRDTLNSSRQPFEVWVAKFFPKRPVKPIEPCRRQNQDYPPIVTPKYPSKVFAIIFFFIAGFYAFLR